MQPVCVNLRAWSSPVSGDRQRRETLDISQEELGHRAEIHPTWISHIESGRNNPAWGSVRRIAAALDLTVAELARLAEELDDA